MKLSVREAKARLSEALDAVTRGEEVIITKRGEPVAQVVSMKRPETEDFFERLNCVRRELGLDKVKLKIGPEFDDPAFSRRVLGLEE